MLYISKDTQPRFFKWIKSDKLKKKNEESINICEMYIASLGSKVVKIKILMRHHVFNKKECIFIKDYNL